MSHCSRSVSGCGTARYCRVRETESARLNTIPITVNAISDQRGSHIDETLPDLMENIDPVMERTDACL